MYIWEWHNLVICYRSSILSSLWKLSSNFETKCTSLYSYHEIPWFGFYLSFLEIMISALNPGDSKSIKKYLLWIKDQALCMGRFYVWITGFTVIPAFYLLFLMFMFFKPQMCKQRLSFCFLATQTQIGNVSTLIKI